MINLKHTEPGMDNKTAKVLVNAQVIDELPIDKVQAMKDYATKLRRNSPKMKPDRLARKVSEKFHVKLV